MKKQKNKINKNLRLVSFMKFSVDNETQSYYGECIGR